jgi:hypothetical protein
MLCPCARLVELTADVYNSAMQPAFQLPPWISDFQSFLADATNLAADNPELPAFEAAAQQFKSFSATVLVSGLRSVGKSSFVCALWGDADLLPTAERDCTQTNTLIRAPVAGENDRRIFLDHLPRQAAVEFAARGLAYHHLADLVAEAIGFAGPRLDEMQPEQRSRTAVSMVKKLFAENPKLSVLHENLTDDINELEQFLTFIDSAAYSDGGRVEAKWNDRREHLMGKRHPDGRTLDVGPLLALRHVELLRESSRWSEPAPRVIDTPWIPAYHNARRMDLILAQARHADVLLILSRPQPLDPEEWVLQILKERPELAARTVVVFNQADTVDITQLFGRDGFYAEYENTVSRLAKLKIETKNIFISCARLPFLELSLGGAGEGAPALTERIVKLRAVLERVRRQAESRSSGEFKSKLLGACNGTDCGVEPVRSRLQELSFGPVYRSRISAVLDAFDKSAAAANNPALWQPLIERASEFRSKLRAR